MTPLKSSIDFMLGKLYRQAGIGEPNNHRDILDFVYYDILDNADTEFCNELDVALSFRRFLEDATN